MLAEALAALAGTAGSALVAAMTTDAWEKTKIRCARLLGGGEDAAEARQARRLDQSRQEILTADDAERVMREHQAVWTARLRDLLEEEPESEARLRELVNLIAVQTGSTMTGSVQVNAQARDQAQQSVQGQGVQNVTFK